MKNKGLPQTMLMGNAQEKGIEQYDSPSSCLNCGGTLRVKVEDERYVCPCRIKYKEE